MTDDVWRKLRSFIDFLTQRESAMDNDLDLNDLSPLADFDETPPRVDAQDLMDAVEADFLENELALDEEGNLVRPFEREDVEAEPEEPLTAPLSGVVDEQLPKEAPPQPTRAKVETEDVLLAGGLEPLDPETLQPRSETSDPGMGDPAPVILLEDEPPEKEQDLLLTGEPNSPQPSLEQPTGVGRTPAPRGAATFQHLQRSFDATDLLAARTALASALKATVPLGTLLGLAAERASSTLGSTNVTLARLQGETLRPFWTLSKGIGLREALYAETHATHEPAGVFVVDLSDLDLDSAFLPAEGLWLSLLRLNVDPLYPSQARGTLNLSGPVGLKSGAAFLRAVSEGLESPFGLVV